MVYLKTCINTLILLVINLNACVHTKAEDWKVLATKCKSRNYWESHAAHIGIGVSHGEALERPNEHGPHTVGE